MTWGGGVELPDPYRLSHAERMMSMSVFVCVRELLILSLWEPNVLTRIER
uniref:Uncharacterized protein n=1 Tax=Anguilla anguilla TaxID=7936 RepID=A0A0E9SSQ0_ANGAN